MEEDNERRVNAPSSLGTRMTSHGVEEEEEGDIGRKESVPSTATPNLVRLFDITQRATLAPLSPADKGTGRRGLGTEDRTVEEEEEDRPLIGGRGANSFPLASPRSL